MLLGSIQTIRYRRLEITGYLAEFENIFLSGSCRINITSSGNSDSGGFQKNAFVVHTAHPYDPVWLALPIRTYFTCYSESLFRVHEQFNHLQQGKTFRSPGIDSSLYREMEMPKPCFIDCVTKNIYSYINVRFPLYFFEVELSDSCQNNYNIRIDNRN